MGAARRRESNSEKHGLGGLPGRVGIWTRKQCMTRSSRKFQSQLEYDRVMTLQERSLTEGLEKT